MRAHFSNIILNSLSIYGVTAFTTTPGTINCVGENLNGNTLLLGTNLNWAGNVATDYRVFISLNAPTTGDSLPSSPHSAAKLRIKRPI